MIFRERREGHKDARLWNSQLIKYAGYEQSDGSIIGDPGSVEFTKVSLTGSHLIIFLHYKGYLC